MNKAFKTNQMHKIKIRESIISHIRRDALLSCHIRVGEVMDLKDHTLRNEVIEKIESGEIVFS